MRRLTVRLTKERQRSSEELYRSLVEQLPAFAYVDALDPASSWGTRTVYASPQVEQLLGVTAHAFVDEPGLWEELVHPDDREHEHALYARLLADGEPYTSELRLVRPDGRIVWIRHLAVPLLGVPGADGAVQGVIYDITADREVHQALLDSEARSRALMEDAPDAVLVVDAQGAISMANRRAEHIFGFEPHELVGRPVEDLVPEHLRRAHIGHRVRYGADPSTRYEALELPGRRKDGTMFPAEISLGFVPVEGEEPIVMAFVRDVTARERAEAALVEAEARYRTLVERIPAIVYVAELGESAPWLFVSPQAGHILGYEPEEWIADEALWMRLIHPEDLERVLQAERATRARGERFECEYRMFARDGREVWIRDEAEVVLDDTGARALLRGIMYDVTERRLAEDALRRHDRILEAVSLAGEALLTGRWEERIDDVVAALGEAADVSRVFVLTTHSAADGEPLLSYRHEWCAPGVESQIGNPDLYDIPVRRPPYSRWADILAAGGIVHGLAHEFPPQERAILDKQGVRALVAVPLLVGGELWGELGFDECVRERVWDRQEVEALRAAAGVLSAAVGRQRSEDAVRASEERFRLLSEAAVEGVIVDVDGTITEANRAFCEMFDLEPDEVVGASLAAAIAPESLPVILEHLRSGGETPTDLDLVRRKGGTRVVLEATLRHIERDGRPARLVTLHDITTRKQAEAALAGLNDVLDQRVRERTQDLEAANVELTTAKEAAEEANRAKSEFLSRASHELRTPLNAILGFGQLLQVASLTEEDEESVEQILTAGGHLLKVVDRVLGIARVDAGAASVSHGAVTLDTVVEGALSIVQAAADAGGVLIHPELRSPVPTVIADRERLAQVFAHLLSNAVKHSREGDVVTVWCERPEGSVRVHITDRGPGIPGERLERLFALFGALEGQTGARQGAGVGFPLAKAWVEAMGGTLGVRSEVGVGTTFTVELAAAEEPVR